MMLLPLLLSILLTPGILPAEAGVVAGALRHADGRPAAGVRVAVMAPPGPGRRTPQGVGTLVIQGQSDDSGGYRLEGVPAGRYYVVAGKLDAPIFYPGVREFATAKVIDVPAKVTVGNINFAVDSVPTARGRQPVAPLPQPLQPPKTSSLNDPGLIEVKGRIVLKGDLTSPPPAAITFEVAVPNGRAVTTLSVAPNGTFALPLKPGDQVVSLIGLPDGYTLASMTSGATSGAKDLRSQPLHVEPSTELVVTLNADARPRFRILGRVVEDATERSLAGEPVELVLPTGEITRTTVNAQGMITFSRLFPGTYILRLVSPRLEVPEKKIIITASSVNVELRSRNQQ